MGLKRGAAGVFALLVLTLPAAAGAAPGDLDSTFSQDGKAFTNATPGFDYASGVVVLAGGEIVTAGPASGGRGRFSLVRYDSDGSRETSFGGGDGIVFTNFTRRSDEAYDIALWNDKFIVAGTAAGAGGRFALARYNDDGTLDTTFGRDGKVRTNLSRGNDWALSVAVQTNNKIVAAGHSAREGGRFAVVRYNANGRLDQTFSGDGKAYVNFTSAMDYVDEIALNDNDDTILAAGIALTNDGGRFALARFEADGDLDTNFSGNGKLTTDFTPRFDGAFGVAIQTDEKIVAVGAAGRNIGLARYEPDGDLDLTFGRGDGKVVTTFTRGVDSADDVVLTAGDEIFVGGVGGLDRVDSKFAIAAYTPTGRLDDSFSDDGKVMTNMSPRFDWALDIAIDPSDKLVAAGIAANTQKSAVARYETN